MYSARTVHECTVLERTMHECTVASGSGREGGTCWEVQLFLPARPALQKAASFFCVSGERCGEPTSSLSAEPRRFAPVNKKKKHGTP